MAQQEQLHYLPFFLTDTLYNLPDEKVIAEAASLNQQQATPAKKAEIGAAPAQQASALPELHTVGKNRKGIAVLVHEKNHPVLSREDGLFLKNVLQAFQLSFDDVLLINTKQCSSLAHWEALQANTFQLAISFGLAELPPFAPSVPQPYQQAKSADRRWLTADSLSEIAADVNRKKLLWNALKQLFVGL